MYIEEILNKWWEAPSRENDLSSKTYNKIKEDLEEHFWDSVDIFLQGSYANRTNIQKDSDIDIVICYKKAYYYDINSLTEWDKEIFKRNLSWNKWKPFFEFKAEVENFLKNKYWEKKVARKDKCIKINKENDLYVDADVIPCFEYRIYIKYNSSDTKNIIPEPSYFLINEKKL